MADPPDNMGGNRVFLADPEATGLSTAVGDMAALQLQLIHALDAVIPAAARGLCDDIADHARQVLAASVVNQQREQSTRELTPITRIPAAAFGANANIAAIRMNNIPIFTGKSSDTLSVTSWLGRILSTARVNNLTFAATINLLIQGSADNASEIIDQMREEDKTLAQIIQALEMRYGDLCTPEEARVRCHNLARKEGEGLSDFMDRLRSMARMACRMHANDAERRLQTELLVEGNIRRILPPTVRALLEERVVNRTRMGLPAFTAREIEKECLDLERRREERRASDKNAAKQQGRILKCDYLQDTSEEGVFAITDDEANSSADEVDPEDEAMYQLILSVKHQERRYAGQNVDPKKIYRSAVRNFNQKHPPPRYPRPNRPYGARMAGGFQPAAQQGPPGQLDVKVRKTISELLALANVQRGTCIQCGEIGHYMHQDACALKDKLLTDRPCAKCGQGLHSADDCMKVYQKQYANPGPAQVNNVPAEHQVKEN